MICTRTRSGTKRHAQQRWRYLALYAGLLLLALLPRTARADRPPPLSAQTLKVPSGPTSLKGLGESFSPELATGTAQYSIGLDVPPGFITPSLSLSYAAGRGNGEFGVGFRLPLLQVYRTTDKGSPEFAETDRFAVSGPGMEEELVPVDVALGHYRLKNEGAYALFIRKKATDSWDVHHADGSVSSLGSNTGSRQRNAARGTYRWFVAQTRDRFGHVIDFSYRSSGGRLYPDKITYLVAGELNSIEFTLEPRPDVFSDFTYGEETKLTERIKTITVRRGLRLLWSYELSYEADQFASFLSGVRKVGYDGAALPTLTLGYLPRSRESGAFTSMARVPSTDDIAEGYSTLEDVNGDGLPDLLLGSEGDYTYYENVAGLRFDGPKTIAGSPPRNLWDHGVVLADMNGDGRRDVFYESDAGLVFHPALDIRGGVFQGFGPARALPTTFAESLEAPEVKLTDLDFDGRTDLLVKGFESGWDYRVRNVLGAELRKENIPALPLDADFGGPDTHLLDFNGDGLLDLVRAELSYAGSRMGVWFGKGDLRGEAFTARRWMLGVPSGDHESLHFVDVNRDRQTDLVEVSGTQVAYYLNDGRQFVGPMARFRGLPPPEDTRSILFADMNGNGTTDVIWVGEGSLSYLELTREPNAGLLSRIDNGMGLVVEVAYRSSTEYASDAQRMRKPWATPLPVPVPVISEVRTTDSLGQIPGLRSTETRTSYSYQDGYWDTAEREFRGFGTVVATEWGDDLHEGSRLETRFHVGRNLTSGADEEPLKGKAYFTRVLDLSGGVLSTAETEWEARRLCQSSLVGVTKKVLPDCSRFPNPIAAKDSLVHVSVPTRALSGAWERSTTLPPRFSLVEITRVNGWGQIEETVHHGEVSTSAARTPGTPITWTEVAGDEYIDERQFTNVVLDGYWLVGLPSVERRLKLGTRARLSETQTYYDGAALVGLPLGQATHGNVSRVLSWLVPESAGAGAAGEWVPTSRAKYNADGLPDLNVDALGSRVRITYSGPLPTSEQVEVDPRSGETESWLTFSGEYDLGYGLLRTARDPVSAAGGYHTEYRWDGLGRLTTVVDALKSESVSYTYTQTSPISTVRTERLMERQPRISQVSEIYVDGYGRTRLTKTQAEAPYQWVASGWQRLSARGAVTHAYDVFSSPKSGIEPAPETTAVTVTRFDPLTRTVRTDYPATPDLGATSTRVRYEPWKTWSFGERDDSSRGEYPEITESDGLGRVRRVTKKNLVNGQSIDLVWNLGSDEAGRLVSFEDPQGHRRAYDYDSLGRLKRVVDPNLGIIRFEYDAAGRLLSRTNAVGHVRRYEYGKAGRLRRAFGERPASAPRTPVITDFVHEYHYDEAAPDSPLPKATGLGGRNLLGKLAWIKFPTGAEHYAYDAFGNLTAQAVELWDGVSPFEAQVRGTFVKEHTYNAAGQVLTTALPGEMTLATKYNARGLPDELRAASGAQSQLISSGLLYDVRGLLLSANHGNGTRTCQAFDLRGRLLETVAGRQATTDCASAWQGKVTGFQHLRYRWGWDGVLNSTQDLSSPDGALPRLDTTYSYDRLRQLVLARTDETLGTQKSVIEHAYAYDAIQNLTNRTITGAGAPAQLPQGSFLYGENGAGPNALTSVAAQKLAYDAAGYLKQRKGFDLTFGASGELIEASKADKRIRFHYDPWGTRRLVTVDLVQQNAGSAPVPRRHVFRYVFEDYQERRGDAVWSFDTGTAEVEVRRSKGVIIPGTYLLDELNAYAKDPTGKPKPLPAEYLDLDGDGDAGFDAADAAEAAHAYWQDQPVGGQKLLWRYLHKDLLDSTTHVSDSVGDAVSVTHYEPYGTRSKQRGIASLYGFTGAEDEPDAELGLLHRGARYYAPDLGRWISPDTAIGESPEQMASHLLDANLYSYAAGGPTFLVDPEGEVPRPPRGARTPTRYAPPPPPRPERPFLPSAVRVPQSFEGPSFVRAVEAQLPAIRLRNFEGPSAPIGGYFVGRYRDLPGPQNHWEPRYGDRTGTERHHGFLTELAQHLVWRYSEREAPAILLRTRDHDTTRRNWNTMVKEYQQAYGVHWKTQVLGNPATVRSVTERLLQGTNVPRPVIEEYLRQFETYRSNQRVRQQLEEYTFRYQEAVRPKLEQGR
jgi:RHS repeat-associated protein